MKLKKIINLSAPMALFMVLFIIPLAIAGDPPPTVESNAEAISTRGLALDTVWVLVAAVL